MPSPESPPATPRTAARSERAAWHVRANAVVLTWFAAAVITLALHDLTGASRWLIVHLLLLGAATNAILVWTAHFTTTLLRAPARSRTDEAARLVALNVALVAVIVGVTQELRGLSVAGAAVLMAVVAWHLAALIHASRAGARERFRWAVRFYWSAAVALLAGVAAGSALAVGVPAAWYPRVYAAHVLLNVFGWVALTVLGTELTMWPMVLRTRMAEGIDATAMWALPVCTLGLAVAVAGALTANRSVAATGLVAYVVGVGVSLDPFLRTAWQRAPHSAASWMLAAATAWLCAGVVAVLAAVFGNGGATALAARVHAVVPWLIPGFVAQVLMGALTYLLPVVLGGGPTGGKRISDLLERVWAARVAVVNVGVVLVALPAGTPDGLDVTGWWLIGLGVGAFSIAAAAAVALVRRDSGGDGGALG